MSAVSFLLASPQQTPNQIPALQVSPDATTTPTNPNQAQGAPVPQDTVILAGQASEGQGASQNQQQSPFQQSILFPAEAGLITPAAVGRSTATELHPGLQATTSATQSPTTNSAAILPSSVASVLQGSAGNGASQGNQHAGQQQQLQQLDQALQQLGVDPQSISLFNQLALLVYVHDPAALQQFVHQMQQSAQQLVQQGVLAQTANQGQTPTAKAAAAFRSPLSMLSLATPVATASPGGSATQTSAGTISQPNTASPQFQELQSTVSALGGQLQLANAATAGSQGQSLNVTF